jgi:hypothetical protein
LLRSLALAVSNGLLRSLDVRRGAAVFVGTDETTIHENSSVLDGFRRLLLQIGANIASADRAL